jgi:SAM-dependent methyltransferase
VTVARYDGQADWYELFSGSQAHERARAMAVELLGDGPGCCVDVGTGTGRALAALAGAGWTVVGVDVSEDQLDVARRRAPVTELLVADAHALPFADGEFDAAISCFTHTDFDDPGLVFAELARVLRPGGRFVYTGVHPCFGSPFIARGDATDLPDVVALLRPGYRNSGWSFESFSPEGIRSRVGINHQPLAGLLNSVLEAGFAFEQFLEPGNDDPPLFFAFVAHRSA